MKRLLRGALAAVAVGTLLAACTNTPSSESDATQAPEPAADTTLVFATGDGEPTSLDPHMGGNMPQAMVGVQVLESLFSLDTEGNVVPWLAESGEMSDDGLTWTLTLREGVTFTDGTPFDSEAVRANIEHLQDPATGSSTGFLALEAVASVDTPEPLTAVLNMSRPDGVLLEALAQPWLAMESPEGLARGLEANGEAPIGTGPFMFEEWNRQQDVVLVRNPDYTSPPAGVANQGPALIDRIEWRFIPDAATRLAALQSGDVDIIDTAQPDAIAAAETSREFQVLIGSRPGASTRLELNANGPTFSDQRVREAFIASANVNPALETLFFGTVDRSYSLLSSSTRYGTSGEELLQYNLDEASRLLDEAGWVTGADGIRERDGQRLVVRIPVSTNQSIPAEVSLLQQIQASTAEAGFDVQLEQLDLATWYERLGAWEFDAVTAPYTKSSADVLRIIFDSAGLVPAPSGYHANNIGVGIPEVDTALRAAAQSTDDAERATLYEQAQNLIFEGAYVLPLYDQETKLLAGPEVQGLELLPTINVAWLGGVTLSE